MCGCNKENNDDEPLEGCCSGNNRSVRRIMCLPYDDPYVIISQILSIVAFLISWIWWGTFIISLLALVLQQIIWCCRQSQAMLIASHVTSFIAAFSCLFSGIYMLIAWKDVSYCTPFLLESDDSWQRKGGDYCPEKAFATVAFVDAALWFASAGFTMAFIISGRHAKWEEKLSSKNSNNNDDETSGAVNVEMGNVVPDVAAVDEAASPAAVEEVAAVAVSTPGNYIPPEVAEKADVESPPDGETAEA